MGASTRSMGGAAPSGSYMESPPASGQVSAQGSEQYAEGSEYGDDDEHAGWNAPPPVGQAEQGSVM